MNKWFVLLFLVIVFCGTVLAFSVTRTDSLTQTTFNENGEVVSIEVVHPLVKYFKPWIQEQYFNDYYSSGKHYFDTPVWERVN